MRQEVLILLNERKTMKKILTVIIVFGLSTTASASGVNLDKSQYNFFNPTPEELMRDMSADRPDKTESPYTVDAGHYQIETSFIDYTYDAEVLDKPNTRVDTFSVMPTNLKIGLLNNLDIQFVINPYVSERTKTNGNAQRKNGFGDIQTRLKYNFWGNDEGTTAFGVMPFVKFPTNGANLGNNDIESGLIFAFAAELPQGWGMGLMTEFDFNKDADDSGYHTEFINTITFGREIIGDLSGYIEFFSNVSAEDGVDWIGTMSAGMTYALTKNVQLDGGINIGVTNSADDLNPFCGLTVRY